jgi:hypothetical protein
MFDSLRLIRAHEIAPYDVAARARREMKNGMLVQPRSSPIAIFQRDPQHSRHEKISAVIFSPRLASDLDDHKIVSSHARSFRS